MGVAMRVALFGGSFDPPHRGHTTIAMAAADRLQLDLVLFAPVGLQPLKGSSLGASFDDRLAMVADACAVDPRFVASSIDAPRPDGQPNYTVDTLERLRVEFPEAHLFNLVGADSFLTLPHWHAHERLFELADWIVVSRPGFPVGDFEGSLPPAQRARVHRIEGVLEDVSATELRHRLESGNGAGDVDDLLDPAVAQYIRAHHLYR